MIETFTFLSLIEINLPKVSVLLALGLISSSATGLLVFALLRRPKERICSLGGLSWTTEQFCHNILVTGAVGSGKSVCLSAILDQLFRNAERWGGLWLDNKGDSHLELLRIAARHGRQGDVIILECSEEPIYPTQRLNLLGIGELTPHITASILAELSIQGATGSSNSGFFKQQTQIHLARAIQFFSYMGLPLEAQGLLNFLTSELRMKLVLEEASKRQDTLAKAFITHWLSAYLAQPPDQRGGVFTSIANALHPLCVPLIAEVFSSASSDTFAFSSIDSGKIICVLVPQSYPRERASLNQYLKTLFYFHGAQRYDKRKAGIQPPNLCVMFLDEAQKSASPSDKDFLDMLRDARCAFIAATQDECSFVPVLGEALSKTVVGKFRNRFIYSAESWESAQRSSNLFGMRERAVSSWTFGARGRQKSVNRLEKPILAPSHFRNLANHYCSILHTDKRWRKKVRLPLIV